MTISELKWAYESLRLPFGFYKEENGVIHPILVSDGLCELLGMNRDQLLSHQKGSTFDLIHPDDVGRISKAASSFRSKKSSYDIIYRARIRATYHLIHSAGNWEVFPDGTELMAIVYLDLTRFQEESEKLSADYRQFQKDHFYTDPLTGVPTLNYFREFAADRVRALRLRGKTPMLLYTDINSMRYYNTHYGFDQGDELLRLVVREMCHTFPDALVMRGPEVHFMIIDAFDGREDLENKLCLLNERIRKKALGNTTGIQVGICVFEDNMTTTIAYDRAKNALKQIRTDLNETDHFYSNVDDEKYWNQRYIIENFDRALTEGWIKIYYQGIMRLETGKTTVQEALARWVDPVRGIISPGEFIPVLQKYHLLYRLDLYMLEQVCKDIPVRLDAGLLLLPVSINFSGQDFDYVDVAAELNRLYEKYNIDQYVGKDYFIIEITEQDMANGTEQFYEQLRRIRSDGYKLWLDDFGSGYSSLNMFSRYDFNLIKFDMELLRNLNDPKGANRRIIKAMIDVARALGIHTLVEGMETEEQKQFLLEVGCELAQGYLFHRPEPLEVILYRRSKGQKTGPCETQEEREKQKKLWTEM